MLINFKKCIELYGNSINGVIHIGAHHGEEIKDYAQSNIKNVIWFEANKKLMRHLFDNTSKYQNVKQEYFCEVLSDVDDLEVSFNITNDPQASSILELGTVEKHYPHIKVIESQKLKTKSFKTFYESNNKTFNLKDFEFINLDVQGAELKVLKGFGHLLKDFQNIKCIYTEVNFEDLYKNVPLINEIDDYLSNFNFNRIHTVNTQYNWGDALYLRK